MVTSKPWVVAAAATLFVALAACSPGSAVESGVPVTPTPSRAGGLIVLGHSGATGFNSDPDQSGTDALTNSWASGTNPDVASIYSRLLATDPGIEGRVSNAAVDGSRSMTWKANSPGPCRSSRSLALS